MVDKVFRAPLTCFELLSLLDKKKLSMIDIGGGPGVHANFFISKGIDVTILDKYSSLPEISIQEDFDSFITSKKFDIVWSSHCLEHNSNSGNFIKKTLSLLKDGGLLVIIVPPLSEEIRTNHLSIWNPGLLLLNLAHQFLDCRDIKISQINYNISIILRKKINNTMSLKSRLPVNLNWNKKFYDGRIKFLNWHCKSLEILNAQTIKEEFSSSKISRDYFKHYNNNCFFFKKNSLNKKKLFYFEFSTGDIIRCN